MWLGWTFFELSISYISTCSLPLYYFFPIRVVAEIKSWSSHVTCSTFLCLLISHTLLLAPNYINLRIHHTPSLSNSSSQFSRSVAAFQDFTLLLYFSSNNLQVIYLVFFQDFVKVVLWVLQFLALLSLTDDWCQNYFLYTLDQMKIHSPTLQLFISGSSSLK